MNAPTDHPNQQSYFASQRAGLVEQLKRSGITDERVLLAIGRIPREIFVPECERQRAYNDHALPIECGQTISQPFTVGFMCQALGLQGIERVLEIGTRSGYNAAVLAELAKEVFSIERFSHLSQLAADRLRSLGYEHVHLRVGDGTFGWPEAAPFDAIIVTAAAVELPETYSTQVIEGGRILAPIGMPNGIQTMMRYTRQGGSMIEEDLGRFQFVPFVSGSTKSDFDFA